MSDLAAIQGWMSNVQSTMAGLPSQVQEAATDGGDFASVFSEAQSVLSANPDSTTATAARQEAERNGAPDALSTAGQAHSSRSRI